MLYNIKLYQYNFDANNENVRLFSDKNERDQYFDSISLFEFNNVNFNANDLIKTTIVLDYSTYALELTKLLNINYCSVENENERIYFKVMQSQQLSNMRILLNLEIDIMQNYIYDATFDTCLIERAHLNRYYKNEMNFYTFDCTTNSKLFKTENIPTMQKRIIKRQRLVISYNLGGGISFDEWLNNNVSCWVYFYMSPGSYNGITGDIRPIIYINDAPNTFFENATDIEGVQGATAVFCVPLFKTTDKSIKLNYNNQIFNLNYNAMSKFLNQNNNNANLYTIKYSYLAPFKSDDYTNLYSISDDQNTLTLQLTEFINFPIFKNAYNRFYNIDNDAFIYVVGQQMRPMLTSYNLSTVFNSFLLTSDDIKTNSNNSNLNPKIYDDKITELVLSDSGNEFSYSIQKLNTSFSPVIRFDYYEMFTPDNTKTLTVYDPRSNGFYTGFETISFHGLCSTNDYSVLFSNDRLAEFLANNKNFYVNFLSNSLSNFAKGLFSGDISKAVSAGIDYIQSGANLFFTQDNLANAPDILKNANGNAIFSNAVADLGIYINIKQAIDCDIQTFNDYTHKYGYTYSQFDKIENHLRTRKIFNYIRANVEGIEGQFSEYVREQMRQLFARGIRFWHVNVSDYEQQNYEIYLDGDNSNGEN